MSSARNQQAWQIRELAFLATALLLHAALLLLPLKPWHSSAPAAAPRLTVDLQNLPRPTSNEPAAETKEEPSQPVELQEPTPERRTARINLEELPIEPDPVQTDAEQLPAEPEAPTTHQLREWIVQSELDKSAIAPERQLGSARSYRPPANWRPHAGAPYLAESDNRFNGMAAPAEVEIVDRWLASDGSQNVVVNLPNGDTVCGRAEPWNPMQPLVEHIMMFRPCGGGGKRTFTMPDRYSQSQ